MPSDPRNRLSDSQIKQAYWYITHRTFLYKIWITVLFLVNVIIIGTGIYLALYYFVIHQAEYDALMADYSRNYVNYEGFRAKDRPQKLQLQSVSVIEAGNEKYDLVAKVVNNNEKWLATVEYQFYVSGVATEIHRDYILPSHDKILVDASISSKKRIANAQFSIIQVYWHKEFGVQEVKDDVLKFEILNSEYIPSSRLNIDTKVQINTLKFDIKNGSSFNFWKIKLIALLYSGSRLVGVNEVFVDNLSAGEQRTVETSWFNKLPNITNSEVIVDLNILDQDNYKDFQSEAKIDIRDYIMDKKF